MSASSAAPEGGPDAAPGTGSGTGTGPDQPAGPPVATVVGDVVESRRREDQAALLEAVAAACDAVNGQVTARQPLQVTVGDELQGAYDGLGRALEAAVRLRARLARRPDPVELRIGLGRGRVLATGAGPPPLGQSGTAWWTARRALDAVIERRRAAHWPRSHRMAFRADGARDEPAVNGMLVSLDELLGRFDPGDWRILTGLLDGRRQVDVAAELSMSQPAVARREQDRGISAAYRAVRALQGADGPGG